MKPRYVVLNEMERDDFEKKHHLSYGYGCLDIFEDVEEAMEEADWAGIGYIVEEVSEDGRQAIYRV